MEIKRNYLVLLVVFFLALFNPLKAASPTAGAPNPTPDLNGADRWKALSLYGYYGEDAGGGIFIDNWGEETTVTGTTTSIGGNECLVIQKADIDKWGGAILRPKSGDYFDFSGGYDKLYIQVWADDDGAFEVQLVNDAWTGVPMTVSGFVANQWKVYEISLPSGFDDFSKVRGVLFIPNYAGNKRYYVDNIYLTRTARPGNEPSDWLTPPERFENSYFSVYNDQPYGDNPGDFSVVWNALTAKYTFESGQYAQKMTLWGPGAIQYVLPAATDLSSFTHVHFDVWPVQTLQGNDLALDMYIPDGDWSTGSRLVIDSVAPAQRWTGFDFDLASFSNPESLSNIKTIRFEGAGGLSSTKSFYLDNFYFYKIVTPTEPAPVPTRTPTTSIFSDTYPSSVSSTWSGVTDGNVGSNNYKRITNLQSGASLTLSANTNVSAGNLLHMDVWVEDARNTELSFQLFDGSGTASDTITISNDQFRSEKWNRINILLSDFGSESIPGALKKITFFGPTGAVYVDNIYFYSETPSTTKSPDPGHTDTENVLTVYSNYFKHATSNPGTGFAEKGTLEGLFASTTGDYYRILPGMSEYADIDLGTPGISSAEWQFIHLDTRAESGTSNLDIRIEGVKLDGTSGATTLSQEIDADKGWTSVDLSTSTANIPSGSKINSIKLAASNGFLFLDNIYLYKSASSQQQNVVTVTGANGADTNKSYPSLFEAFTAISNVDQTDAIIEVLINKDSREDRKIIVNSSTWDSLTIKPVQNVTVTFQPLASLDQTALFEFSNTRNLTIDGAVNGVKSLTFVGYYNVNNSYEGFDMNSIIRFSQNEAGFNRDIFIRNCIFTNPDLDRSDPNRSISSIICSGVQNITIQDNEFRNCLSFNIPGTETLTSVVNMQDVATLTGENNWLITGNRFYETETDLPFSNLSYLRAFINITVLNAATNVVVSHNNIGGNTLAGGSDFAHSGVSTSLTGVRFLYNNLNDPMTGKVSIKNNTISNINFDNQTNSFKYYDNLVYTEGDQLASFAGIEARRGNVEISGNTIENITWRAREFDAGSAYTEALTGIAYSADMENFTDNLVCDGNNIKDIAFTIAPNGNKEMVISCDGIRVTAAKKLTAQISNNLVIWGLNDTYSYEKSSDFSGIFFHDYSTGTVANVFNNVVAIKEFNAGNLVNNISAYWFYIQDPQSESAVFNVYNNIAYVQNGGSGFTNGGLVNGIRCVFYNTMSADKINIYQNTSFVNNIGGNQQSTTIIYDIEKEGKLRSWNNNFVNMNVAGTLVALNDGAYAGGKNPITFDYNNYYSPKTSDWEYLFATGYSGTTGGSGWQGILTFDKWKFDNTIWILDSSGEQDFHSSFVNPKFNGLEDNSISIPFTFDGLKSLKTLLDPVALLAGRNLSSLPGSGFDVNGSARRTGMPTAGAIESELPNCWVGTDDTDWGTASNWSKNTVPDEGEDVVFHPTPKHDLILDGPREVRNIFNDSDNGLQVNGQKLTVSGVIRMEGAGKVDASTVDASTIIYKPGINNGAVVQHLFSDTYLDNKVSNLTLTNQADYFVLLYDTLDIVNQLTVLTSGADGAGALNCYHYDTELIFSGKSGQVIPPFTLYKDTLYNLVIDGVKVTTNQDNIYAKNDLTIHAGKVFEIPAGNFVKVDGTTVNSNGVNGLLIESATDKPNATFIFNQNNPVAVPATVKMYSKSSMEGKPANEYVWQYFGIPVTEVLAENSFSGSFLREWNKAGNAEDETNFYWQELKTGDVLFPFTGYEISNPTARTITFRGNLVKNDTTLELHYYSSNVDYHGQHILANPYTAAINIDNLQFGDDMDKTVYLYNTGSYDDWVSGGSGLNNDGNAAGRYLSIPQKQAGSAELSGEIPSMQGFLIKANAGGNLDNQFLTISYPSVATKNTTMQRMAGVEKSTEEKIYTIIDVETETNAGDVLSDRMWLFTEDNCTRGFDNGWDGPKLFGSSNVPQIFAVEKAGSYQVNSIPDIHNTTVGFMPGQEGSYTLRFKHKNAAEKYGSIYLLDFVRKTVTDVTENDTEYKFTSNGNEPLNRFKIVTRFIDDEDNWENAASDGSLISFFAENKTIYVLNPTDFSGDLFVYDLSGRLLDKRIVAPQTITMAPLSLISGTYLVKIQLENGSQVAGKVLLK